MRMPPSEDVSRSWLEKKTPLSLLSLFLSLSFFLSVLISRLRAGTSYSPPSRRFKNQFVCPDNRSGFGMISRDRAQVKLSTFKGTNVHIFSSPTTLKSEGISSNLLSAHTDKIRTRSTTWYEWNLATAPMCDSSSKAFKLDVSRSNLATGVLLSFFLLYLNVS